MEWLQILLLNNKRNEVGETINLKKKSSKKTVISEVDNEAPENNK